MVEKLKIGKLPRSQTMQIAALKKTFDTGYPKMGRFCEMVIDQALVIGKPDHHEG